MAEFGTPLELGRCGGWILKRQIPGFSYYDAMGCYPLFACRDWSELYADLEDIGHENGLVSLSLVTDPFGDYDPAYLRRCFKNVVIPFKEHFIIDLSHPMDTFVCSHHRRYARKALRQVHVEKCEDPAQFINEWVDLYAALIERHNIAGILAFSELAFKKQLNVPGIVVFRAVYEETTVAMLLWYVQGEVGYYHLGASSDLGYELQASFALFWSAIEYFAANGLRWLNLGAGAGVSSDGTDGLSQFKRGWSTGTRTAYFCGRIFDHAKYSEIVQAKGIPATDYFPAYRQGEFR
jgi:hypothetical protein